MSANKEFRRPAPRPASPARQDVLDEPEGRSPNAPSARGRALILIAFVLLYALACFLPAMHLEGQQARWSGIEALVFGAAGLKLGQFAWLANITGVLALRYAMIGASLTSSAWSLVSLLLSLHVTTLFGKDIQIGRQDFNVVHVTGLGAGYYIWVLALLLPLIASLLLRAKPRFVKKREFAG